MPDRSEQTRVVGWRSETGTAHSLPTRQRGRGETGWTGTSGRRCTKSSIADRLIDAADIVVEVVNGEVSLNGTVPSQDQRMEAATAARRVAGVTGVFYNLLDVALPVGDYLEDAALAQRVNGALAAETRRAGWCPGNRS